MKLSRIIEWVRRQIERYRPGGRRIGSEPESWKAKQLEQIEEKVKSDCQDGAASVDTMETAISQLREAGRAMDEKKELPKEQPMSNNRRRMKGIPMIRRQQLKKVQRRIR